MSLKNGYGPMQMPIKMFRNKLACIGPAVDPNLS
jgi:hypothetical protein